MKSKEFVDKAKELSTHKTMYIKDCPGVYLTQANKLKYTSNNAFNTQRSGLIFGATDDTFGLDAIGMVNVLTGERFKNISEIAAVLSDISKDFSSIEAGELVFAGESVGVYIGDAEVITVTAIGVSKVSLDGWKSHGKLASVDYSFREEVVPEEKTEDPVEVEEAPHAETKVAVRPSRTGRRH